MSSGTVHWLHEQGQILTDRSADMLINWWAMAHLQELQQHVEDIVAALSQQLLRHGAQAAAHLPNVARAPSSSLEQSYIYKLTPEPEPSAALLRYNNLQPSQPPASVRLGPSL